MEPMGEFTIEPLDIETWEALARLVENRVY